MPERFPDIASLIAARARTHALHPAVETPAGEVVGYAALADHVARVFGGLVNARIPTRRRRPRIAIVMPNGAELSIALLAASIAGEAAPFNPASTAPELDVYFRDTGVDAVLLRADDNGPAVAVAEAARLPLLRLTPRLEIAGFEASACSPPQADPDDVALVLLTSGSTGRPKIVPLTHRNVCTSAHDVARSLELTESDRCLTMWEQYHIGGLVDLLLAPLAAGGRVILTSGFDADRCFELLRSHQPTWFQAVPTTLNELVFCARRRGLSPRPNSLRLVRSVAAALAPTLMEEVQALFGVPVIQTFGMTEAGPLITSTGLHPADRLPGSVGRSCGPEIRIVAGAVRSAQGHAIGEVAIRGANVFAGYENDDEANRLAFREGWFFTGDTGYLDDAGNLFLSGRIKQLINRGGEKVNPQEVDDALLCHPAVAEAATVAVRHRTLGEDVAAAVALKAPATADELRAFLTGRLAAFKIPGQILLLERLPRNPVGKLDRTAVSGMIESTRADRGHVAPRNALEELLAGIWARELGIPSVGIHDDFAVLGGDSLSSVRIMLALETAIGVRVPEHVFANASTVARIADGLAAAGVTVGRESAGDAAVASLLSKATAGTRSVEESPDVATAQIEAAASAADLRVVHDAMTLYGTPAEVVQFLHATRRARAGKKAAGIGLRARIGLRIRHARWRMSLQREVTATRDAAAWRRERLSEAAFLYTAHGRPEDKSLIVGFGGNYLRLMVATYSILTSLDPRRHDLLLLADDRRTLFLQGVAGIAGTLDDLCDGIADLATARRYQRVVALGTSAGGPAAIYAAIRGGWAKAVAVGPGSPARHPDMARALNSVAPLHDARKTDIVIVTSANARDIDAANQFRSLLRAASLRRDGRFSGHNLLHELHRRGELRTFLAEAIGGALVPEPGSGQIDSLRAAG